MRSWNKSRELLQRAKGSLVGGVSSPFRAKCPVPLYFKDGVGARLHDVDNNEYIDYALAWGPLILGHCHPALVRAMQQQANKPHNFGAQHETEFLAAEKIQELCTAAERILFTSSGSEAVQIATRLARAFTGRKKILKFEGHYHGWMDSTLLSYKPSAEQVGSYEHPHVVPGSAGQVENAAENVDVAPWNDIAALEKHLQDGDGTIAAVLMEPVLCNSGCLMPQPEYLKQVRELCTKHGVLLIFDEVITGFRIAPGGAQAEFGVYADLVTYGKAVAGGMPVSVVAGRADILEKILTGGVAFGGTFNGNPLVTAAMLATLTEISKFKGEALRRANQAGRQLIAGLIDSAKKHGFPIQVTGFGAAFALHFTSQPSLVNYRDTLDDDRELLQRFLLMALERGLNLLPDGRFYVSTSHTARDIGDTLQIIDDVFAELH